MAIADPAWFYSSLAQASAAIVGLIGGLLISRLIDHGAAVRARRRDLEQVGGAAKDTIRGHLVNWQDAIQGLRDEIKRAQRAAARERAPGRESSLGISALQHSWGVWDFGAPSGALTMDEPDEYLAGALLLSGELKIALEASTPLTGSLSAADLNLAAVSRRQAAQRISNQEGIRLLQQHAESLEGLERQVIALENALLPKSLAVVAALLLWLATTGVFWPLAVLPGLEGPSKGLMLVSLALGIAGLNACVAFELWALRRVGVIRWEDL